MKVTKKMLDDAYDLYDTYTALRSLVQIALLKDHMGVSVSPAHHKMPDLLESIGSDMYAKAQEFKLALANQKKKKS